MIRSLGDHWVKYHQRVYAVPGKPHDQAQRCAGEGWKWRDRANAFLSKVAATLSFFLKWCLKRRSPCWNIANRSIFQTEWQAFTITKQLKWTILVALVLAGAVCSLSMNAANQVDLSPAILTSLNCVINTWNPDSFLAIYPLFYESNLVSPKKNQELAYHLNVPPIVVYFEPTYTIQNWSAISIWTFEPKGFFRFCQNWLFTGQ